MKEKESPVEILSSQIEYGHENMNNIVQYEQSTFSYASHSRHSCIYPSKRLFKHYIS